MGLLERFRNRWGGLAGRGAEPDAGRLRTLPDPGDTALSELPLSPEKRRITQVERDRIDAGVEAVQAEGVDIGDLASISDGLDRALTGWLASNGTGDHGAIVERYAMAIGEHLDRESDLSWQVVTDVFGTDLAVAAGDFVVVPNNVVAVRWMRRERGWVSRVVGHIVEVRRR